MPTPLSDFIDPARVPFRTLSEGSRIPGIGLGTFGSDAVDARQVAAAVRYALEIGHRHVDCAAVYGNEPEIGAVLADALAGRAAGPQLKREELWVTSKLWNDRHAPADVAPSFEKSLRDLGLDYLDLYLIHWPFPNFHPPKCDVGARAPDARPYIPIFSSPGCSTTWFPGASCPSATRPWGRRANLEAVASDLLTPPEPAAIAGIDRDCRLIKGQVFLWPGAADWTALWDPDDRIPGWKA
jgi:hypothetical protein